jgi:hypothetical protein
MGSTRANSISDWPLLPTSRCRFRVVEHFLFVIG